MASTPLSDRQSRHVPRMRVEFWTHVEFAGFLECIVTHLKEHGREARQRFLVSEVDYRTARNFGARVWLRIRMFVVFPALLVARTIFQRKEAIIVVTSNPFYAPFLANLFASRKVHVVHLLYDIYPDALVIGGRLRENGVVSKLLDRVQTSMIRRCEANVLLGKRMLERVRKRFGEPRIPVVIPVGTDDEVLQNPMAAKTRHAPRLSLLYCGNMGDLHDADTLLSAITRLFEMDDDVGLDFIFHASGSGYERLRLAISTRQSVGKCVRMNGYLHSSEWGRVMSETDIALVTIKPGAENVMMPAKAYSAMQAGQAILAIAPSKSELAELLLENECGWVIEPGDVQGLVALLRHLPSDMEKIRRMQANALCAANERYSASIVADRWEVLFASLDGN